MDVQKSPYYKAYMRYWENSHSGKAEDGTAYIPASFLASHHLPLYPGQEIADGKQDNKKNKKKPVKLNEKIGGKEYGETTYYKDVAASEGDHQTKYLKG